MKDIITSFMPGYQKSPNIFDLWDEKTYCYSLKSPMRKSLFLLLLLEQLSKLQQFSLKPGFGLGF